jgi:hypothetical protein
MEIKVEDVLTELNRMIASCGGDGRSYRSLINRYIKELEDRLKPHQQFYLPGISVDQENMGIP